MRAHISVFKQALEMLGISYQMSTAYHPVSQGALDRFHQTLKAMLHCYFIEMGRDWAEGFPNVMFTTRKKYRSP